jgi:general secretion pathway protein L
MISVGIDIGNFSIKVVEIDATLKPHSVTQFREFPLSQDPNKDRKIEVVDILRGLVSQYEGMPAHFTLAVPTWKTSVRRKIFPFKERHKILKSLPFELEEDIPFAQEDAIFEAKICRYIGPTAEVLAIATPDANVKEKVQLSKDIGADMQILSVDGLALINLSTDWWEPPRQDSITPDAPMSEDTLYFDETRVSSTQAELKVHVHMGHDTTLVLFYSNDVVKAVRNIDWGGRILAEAVSRKYSIHFVEAVKEVQKKAFLLIDNEGASKDQITFSETLKAEVKKLIRELRLTFVEIESELQARVHLAEISGGVAQMKNLGAFFTQSLEIPFNRFATFQKVPAVQLSTTPQIEAVAPVALALAIEGIKKARNPAVNLLKGPFSRQGQGFKPLWDKWGHAIKVGATAFLFLLIWSSFRMDQARWNADEAHLEMKNLAQSAAGLSRQSSGSTSAIQKFLTEQDRIEKNRQSAEKINYMISAMAILEQISAVLPNIKTSPIDVMALSIDNELVVIQGEVTTAATAQTIEDALQKIASDGRVRTRPPNFEASPGKRVFGYQFQVRRFEGGQ